MSSESRPQAIEFNVYVFVTDGGVGNDDGGGGGYMSTILVWRIK